MYIPKHIKAAIRSGPIPKIRDLSDIKNADLTRGERVIRFIEKFCRVPEGKLVGQPIVLELFQKLFILAIYDNPRRTRRAILAIARKNGKSALIACLLLAHLIGPEALQNSQIISGAITKHQASLVLALAEKMISLNPKLAALSEVRMSQKLIRGSQMRSEYKALASDGPAAQGLSPILGILDETGQVKGAGGTDKQNAFINAITTSQGAHEDPLLIVISTQSANDSDLLSVWIDDAERTNDPHTVCHVYETPEEYDLMDPKGWTYSNPALDLFRNRKDLEEQLKRAQRVPALEASSRNLLLNQRVSSEGLWLAPSVWKSNNGAPDLEIFRDGRPVAMGVDLSSRQDLTACVLAAEDDDEVVHLLPYVFCPGNTAQIKEHAKRDRAPYDVWIKARQMFGLGDKTIDYKAIAEFMRDELDEHGIEVSSIEADSWRLGDFERECDALGMFPYAQRNAIPQTFQAFSPRMECFQSLLLDDKVRHGGHPLLNMAASNAIAERSSNNAMRMNKTKSTQRIDPLVAAVMAAYAVSEGDKVNDDLLATLIG